jgi:hypothetical protein
MNKIVFLNSAKNEFKEAVNRYEDIRKSLGLNFEYIILEKIEIIRNFPKRYPIRKNNFRETRS